MVKEIDSESLRRRIDAGEAVHLVDIRTPGEVAQAAIPDAVHLPMHLLPLKLSELPRDREIVLYCRSGARSYHACMYLMQQGMNNVVNLQGGIIAWARSGYPIISQ